MLGYLHTKKHIQMTIPNDKEPLSIKEVDSIKIAVNDVGIQAIHPDKMESFAEHLVQKLKQQNTTVESTKEQ